MSKVTLDQMPRSPTSKRMIHRVTPTYDNSYVGKYLYEALGKEFDGIKEIFHTLREQRFPETVTWAIRYLEYAYSIEPDESLTLEERRARIKRKKAKRRPLNPAILEEYINEAWNILSDIDEKVKQGYMNLEVIADEDDNYKKMIKDVMDKKPAHLVLAILFDIFFGDDDDDTQENLDYVNDDGDDAFYLETDLAYEDDVPYGSWFKAPKFDGKVQFGEVYSFNGNLKYDGQHKFDGLNTDAEQFAESCNWWFAPNGSSRFNGEFQFDSAIRFDGKRPYKVEYDDGMDELAFLEVNQSLEDDIKKLVQFDGSSRLDGNVKFGENPTPTDSGGEIEISKFRRFDGSIRFDGGDKNLFNGSLRFNGLFDFGGNGDRARIESFKDNISGDLSLVRPPKEEPFGMRYQEIFDYVPLTTDNHLLNLELSAFEDNARLAVKFDGSAIFDKAVTFSGETFSAIDNNGEIELAKVQRFDGNTKFDGGNINYFNGAMKFDGNFKMDGGGSKPTIESIGKDAIDGDLSITRPPKHEPPNYIEIFDYVPLTNDTLQADITLDEFEDKLPKTSIRFDGQTKFSKTAAFKGIEELPTDESGELSIQKVGRFDGLKQFDGGNSNHFNGSLRFDNNFRFDGGDGNKAEVKTILTDVIEGEKSLTNENHKVTPPNYVEIFDYVPATSDEQSADIELDKFDEDTAVNAQFDGKLKFDKSAQLKGKESVPVDCNGEIIVERSRRFDSSMQFDGGDTNSFDGRIKLDGQFDFAGDGNKFSTERFSDVIDGEKSLQRGQKVTPPAYIEIIDLIPQIVEEAVANVMLAFEDTYNTNEMDGCGEIEIKRSMLFNGNFRFDGNFRQSADGDRKFDGSMQFGGNGLPMQVFTYNDELCGSLQILRNDTEKWTLPIATRTKLGCVIVGDNLSVNTDGTIYLSKENISDIVGEIPMMKEVESNVLVEMFAKRQK